MSNPVRSFIRRRTANFVDFSLDSPSQGLVPDDSGLVFAQSSFADQALPNSTPAAPAVRSVVFNDMQGDTKIGKAGTPVSVVITFSEPVTLMGLPRFNFRIGSSGAVFYADGTTNATNAVANTTLTLRATLPSSVTEADNGNIVLIGITLDPLRDSITGSNSGLRHANGALPHTVTDSNYLVDNIAPAAALSLVLGHGVSGVANFAEATASSGVVRVTGDSGVQILVTFTDSSYSRHSITKTVTGAGETPVPVVLTAEDLAVFGSVTVEWDFETAKSAYHYIATLSPGDTNWYLEYELRTKATDENYPVYHSDKYRSLYSGSVANLRLQTLVSGAASASSVFTVSTVPNSAPVPITVTATVTDTAGNSSPVVSASFSLDTATPAPRFSLGADVSDGATLAEATASPGVLSLTAESGSTVLLTFTDSALPTAHRLVKTVTASGAAQAITLLGSELGSGASQLSDGSIGITATATDAAGNVSSVGSSSFTLDSVAPAVSNSAGAISVVGNKVTLYFNETLDSDITHKPTLSSFVVKTNIADKLVSLAVTSITIRGNRVVLSLAVAIPDGGSASVAYTDLSSGDDSRAIQDAAGNDLASFAALPISNQKPATPVLALGAGVSDGATQIEATASTGVVNVKAGAGADVLLTFTDSSNALHSITKTVKGNGAIPVPVVLTADDLAVFGTITVKWDLIVPVGNPYHNTSSLSPGDYYWTSTQQEFIAATNTPVGKLYEGIIGRRASTIEQLKALERGPLGSATDSTVFTVISTVLATISVTATTTATDLSGISSAVASASFTLDTFTNTPVLTLGAGVSGTANRSEASDSSGVIGVVAESGSSVLVTFTDSATPTPHSLVKTAMGTGVVQAILLANSDLGQGAQQLQDGSITVTATASDVAGNVSRPGSSSFVLDATAPTLTPPANGTPALVVVGNKLTLHFSETLDGSTALLNSAFAVSYTPLGGNRQRSDISSVVVMGKQLVLYTGVTVIPPGASVTLSYTAPGSDAASAVIQDLVGNDTASFSQTVANLTPSRPTVVGVAFSDESGDAHYGKPGMVLTATIRFNEPVIVSGSASFALRVVDGPAFVGIYLPPANATSSTSISFPVTLPDTSSVGYYNGKIQITGIGSDAASHIQGSFSGQNLLAGEFSNRLTDSSYQVDSLAPAAPVIKLGPSIADGATQAEVMAASGLLTVNAESGSTVVLTLRGNMGAAISKTLNATGSAQTVTLQYEDLSQLPSDSYHISAVATDLAGNASSTSSSFTLDYHADLPWLTLGSGISDGATRAEALASTGVVKVQTEAGSTIYLTFTDSARPSAHSVIKTVLVPRTVAVPVTLSANDLGSGEAQLHDGLITVTASATDAAGNVSYDLFQQTHSSTSSFVLDSVAPQLLRAEVVGDQLSLLYDSVLDSVSAHLPDAAAFGVVVNGLANAVTAVTVTGGSTLLLTLDQPVAANATASIRYAAPAPATSSGRLQDLAGNAAADVGNLHVRNSTPNRPLITAVALTDGDSGAAKQYGKQGASGLTATLSFSEDVHVSGTLTLLFGNLNGAGSFEARLAADADASTFSRKRTVTLDGNTLPTGNFAVYLKGVSLASGASISAQTPSNGGSGGVLDGNSLPLGPLATGYVVDNTPPAAMFHAGRVFAVDSSGAVIDPFLRDTLLVGDRLVAEIPLTEASTIVGKPEITIHIGSATRTLVYEASYPGTRSNIIYATYSIAAGDADADGISSWGQLRPATTGTTSLTDLAGNQESNSFDFTLKYIDSLPWLKVDAVDPRINRLTPISPGMGHTAYHAGEQLLIAVAFSEKVLVTGTPQITLDVGSAKRSANYDSNNPLNTDTVKFFSYTIVAADTDTDGITIAADALSLNSGTITDVVGNAASLGSAAFAANAAYPVDTTAPAAPTLVLGNGVGDGANWAEALARTGVVTVQGESGCNVLITFSDSASPSHSVIKTVLGTGSTQTVTLQAIDLAAGLDGAPNQLQDGNISVMALVQDGAGNTSPTVSSRFSLVAHAPTSLVRTLSNDVANGVANSATLTEATADSGNGGTVATLTAAPVFTKPSLLFSNDTGILGDFKTSTRTQTITAWLSNALAAGESIWGTVNAEAATPTWINLDGFTTGNTVSWTGVTLGDVNTHTLKLEVRDLAGNAGTLLTQDYTVI